ncbi:MAG: DUF4132 domain-containing protein [Eubacterium sp.]|nr:DUF4132 domain-containing protein [Eubacterium sp.]
MEISEIKELGKKVEREYIEGDKNKIKEFGTEVSNLLEKLDNNCSFYSNSCVENCLGKEFRLALKNNVKPSDFFKSNINRMQGFISDELLPYFYISLDSVNLWQIDRGHSYRQSYRAKSDYLAYIDDVREIIREYRALTNYGVDLYDLLTENVSEELKAYFETWSYKYPRLEYYLAARLDQKDEKLEEILTDIFFGQTGEIKDSYIRAICMSHNEKMYEVLGKTLLAARLSEGLRQSIVENADYGTIEAFKYLLKVIKDNNLIRYSSIQRAICTYLGLIANYDKPIDRITNKELNLMVDALEDENERQAMLESKDAVKCYVGLWAGALIDVGTAYKDVVSLVNQDDPFRRKVACYFLINGSFPYSRESICKGIVRNYYDDLELMAIIMKDFMSGASSCMRKELYPDNDRFNRKFYERKHVYADYSYYFDSLEETKEFLDIFYKILEIMPKKGVTFSPSVFPWNDESLTRSDLWERIGFLVSALKDEEGILNVARNLKELTGEWGGSREDMIDLLLREPESKELMEILTLEIADAGETSRKLAYNLLVQELICDRSEHVCKELVAPKGQLPECSYMILEDLLRLKKADVRSNILKLLKTRPYDKQIEMLKRLLKDKKEEKVTAGLDIIMQLKKNNSPYFEEAKKCMNLLSDTTTKEQILIDEILEKSAEEKVEMESLFDKTADYDPQIDEEYVADAIDTFLETFKESSIGEDCYQALGLKNRNKKFKLIDSIRMNKAAKEDIELLFDIDNLVRENENLEYDSYSEPVLISRSLNYLYENGKCTYRLPYEEIWDKFYEERNIKEASLVRLKHYMYYVRQYNTSLFFSDFRPVFEKIYGPIIRMEQVNKLKYRSQVLCLLEYFLKKTDYNKNREKYSIAIGYYLLNCNEEIRVKYKEKEIKQNYYQPRQRKHDPDQIFIKSIFEMQFIRNDIFTEHTDDRFFPLYFLIDKEIEEVNKLNASFNGDYYYIQSKLETIDYLSAFINGYITEDFMYRMLLSKAHIENTFEVISDLYVKVRERDKRKETREKTYYFRKASRLEKFLKIETDKNDNLSSDKFECLDEIQKKKVDLICKVYEKIFSAVLRTELYRGETETEYSSYISKIKRIYGVKNFVQILSALGQDTIDRSGISYYRNSIVTKRSSLSYLLGICVPDSKDGDIPAQAKLLKELISGRDIKESRLIEAGLFSLEWLPVIEKYLDWPYFTSGAYYFIAHMNDNFSDAKKAMIAKYTPLTADELNIGAFDVNWFKEVYAGLGKKRFDLIYKAAKYISDGTKHTRARKFADAASGILEITSTEAEIEAKRNKDLLMAYALIPTDKKDESVRKYNFIQRYVKESKKFGAQRRASEKAAGEMAIKNMARTEGYDETRFIMMMERNISQKMSVYFVEKPLQDYKVFLSVEEDGKVNLSVKKDDKVLKSIPAAIKKDEYILELSDAKKTFTDQYKRTRHMLEEAMEDETEFFLSEILSISKDPVLGQIVNKLVFKHDDFLGFVEDFKDKGFKDDDKFVIAHPYHLFKLGRWHEFQKICFEKTIKQPFKQVFRELYVKDEDELKSDKSVRYAGNQIRPKMAMALLKSRRWIPDLYEGIQKVYYKENIIATIWALADWFSPSDVEEPNLEAVIFFDRKTFEKKAISEIPDIIFSEVMRDVDLVVSCAHAGDIDPEMTHSTIEMRRAIAEFLIPMFKLKNVELKESHAIIKGQLATYNLHLGSGVIHQQAGPMINVLPVHSQKRGRIFLPFVDDDPKTSEIMSKLIMLSEDKKIKDPAILAQIIKE